MIIIQFLVYRADRLNTNTLLRLIFGRSSVRILAGTPAIMRVFVGFSCELSSVLNNNKDCICLLVGDFMTLFISRRKREIRKDL
jgi:hypothetical protein